MSKQVQWLCALLGAVVIGSVVWLLNLPQSVAHPVAVIMQDGVEIQRIDLTNVQMPCEWSIYDAKGGENVIRVEEGRIGVVSADCPDQVCVRQGYIENSVVPIACLPHKLLIEIEGGGGDLDASVH